MTKRNGNLIVNKRSNNDDLQSQKIQRAFERYTAERD